MTDPEAEYQRIRSKYAPARPRDLVLIGLVIGALCVASILHWMDWALALACLVWFAAWELTKLRLRRNASEFARGPRP